MEPTRRLSARPSTLALALPLALGATLAACAGGSIRVVDKTPAHGELALLGNRDEARNLARSYMEKHCPKGYQVLDDGKTYVGAPHREIGASEGRVGAKNTEPDHVDIGASEGRAGVKGTDPDKMQWRIRYQCDGENHGVSPPQ
jgi:hypothetical protein